MSTVILRKTLNQIRDRNIKIFSVDTKIENLTLGEYVKHKRGELKLSILDVEKRSRAGGATGISNGYITQIEKGDITNVSPKKLKALAKGLGVPEFEIAEIAGFKPSSEKPALEEVMGFFSGFEDLEEDEREEFKPTLVMIANDIRRRLSRKKEENQ